MVITRLKSIDKMNQRKRPLFLNVIKAFAYNINLYEACINVHDHKYFNAILHFIN